MNFVVYMNKGERHQIRDWVLKYKDLETGGDLFGLWLDEKTAVVQFVLGPGENCSRTTTSFFQDVDYLREAGTYLTEKHGLCNIGQWHSHHRINLFKPSAGDENTVWSNMPNLGLDRYIVFIANIIDTDDVTINCFLFQMRNFLRLSVEHGKIRDLDGNSPLRLNNNILQKVHKGAESFNSITVFNKEREHIHNIGTREDRDNSLKKLNSSTHHILKNSQNKDRQEDYKLEPLKYYDHTLTGEDNQRQRDYRGKTLKETGYNAENFGSPTPKNKPEQPGLKVMLKSSKPNSYTYKSEKCHPSKTAVVSQQPINKQQRSLNDATPDNNTHKSEKCCLSENATVSQQLKNKQQRSLKGATLESPKPDNYTRKSEKHSPSETEAGFKKQRVHKVEFKGTDSSTTNVIVKQPDKQARIFNRSSLKRKSGDYDNVIPTENEYPKCKASKPNEAYKVNEGEINAPSKCNLEKIDERPSTPSGRIHTEGIQDPEGEKADGQEITENSWLSHFRIMCCRMKSLSINKPKEDEIKKSVENDDKSG